MKKREYLSHQPAAHTEEPASKRGTEVEPGWAAIFKQRFPEVKDYCRFDEKTGSSIILMKNAQRII